MAKSTSKDAPKTKGERAGVPATPDEDASFHVYEFEDVEPGATEGSSEPVIPAPKES